MVLVAEVARQAEPFFDRVVAAPDNAGALSLAERYRAGGATKPYVLTEFGPPGSWEVPKSDWGAPLTACL